MTKCINSICRLSCCYNAEMISATRIYEKIGLIINKCLSSGALINRLIILSMKGKWWQDHNRRHFINICTGSLVVQEKLFRKSWQNSGSWEVKLSWKYTSHWLWNGYRRRLKWQQIFSGHKSQKQQSLGFPALSRQKIQFKTITMTAFSEMRLRIKINFKMCLKIVGCLDLRKALIEFFALSNQKIYYKFYN